MTTRFWDTRLMLHDISETREQGDVVVNKGVITSPSSQDIDEVIEAAARTGISKPVVRLIPVGNVKG